MILLGKRNILIKIILGIVICLFLVQPNQILANQLVGQEDEIIRRINLVRSAEGLSILNKDNRLMNSALSKANDMSLNNYFSHPTLNDLKMFYWINGADYSYDFAGENLAKGFTSIDRLIDAWVFSPTHYKNIVNHKFKDTGIGIAKGVLNGKEIVFIVQHFGLEKKSLSYIQQNVSSVLDYVNRYKTEINKPIVLGAEDNILNNIDTDAKSLATMDIKILFLIAVLGLIGYRIETINSFIYSSK